MKDINELKRQWQQLNSQPNCEVHASGENPGTSDNAMRSIRHKANSKVPRSIKSRLQSRLCRMYVMMMGGILLLPSLQHELQLPLWLACSYITYFLIAAILNSIQLISLKRADFASMTTIEAINFVTHFTLRRKRFRIILITIGFTLLTALGFIATNHNDPWLIIGMIAGALFGAAIGLSINNRFNADLRLLRSYLGEDTPEE